tara:strand:- start:268 stop:687 length:420 start_codon:yes stop_codon:yes gene_type:complete
MKTIENMENNDSDLAPQTIIYKNQGAISNLQKQVEYIMSQLTKNVGLNANQNAQLNTLGKNISNAVEISNEADKIANANKQAILKIINAQAKKAKDFKNKASKLPTVGKNTIVDDSKDGSSEMNASNINQSKLASSLSF